ncbi:hypothetical protein Q7C36_004041 [Tachysurus vachellii]|uniref:US22 family protein n=1 Tax=Tachysurus vachellii TaxID=175792 RepID=A0AA88NR63_TACVA|nr:uncharacterized protein LOC132842549 [Tachysurus vachellii]KAK2864887.1 hypothetical protein Q7C36_004041 [Tachysurus vachellii]
MSDQDQIMKDFLLPDLSKDGSETYIQKIRNVALKHSQSSIQLKKYSVKVGSLAVTAYKDEPKMKEEWEKFYLPDHMYMEVIGVVEKFSGHLPNDGLVLMVCEDGKVFAYNDNTLYHINNNLKELFVHGFKLPGIKSYYHGQSFEDMTAEDWDKIWKSKEVREKNLMEQQKFLESMKDSFLTNLDIIFEKKQEEPSSSGGRAKPIPVL